MERRVRTGCLTCRRRRVKCDQAKPTCERCRTANFVCEGYEAPRQAPARTPPRISPPPRSRGSRSPLAEMPWRHADWRQEQLPLYHHFVTITAFRLFRNDHVQFWRDQVAQMSYGVDIVYEALLAIGAMHRAILLRCQVESQPESAKFRVLALRMYGNVIRSLPKHLNQNSIAEIYAVLVVLMLLAYFECFMENPKASFRHLWAAIQLLRKSEGRLSNSEVLNMVPVYDAMLRLDFLAQKLVPYARSSFLKTADLAINESPFWNRQDPEFVGVDPADRIATERYRLIQLICAHNKLSRIIWGCWCPVGERPSREELMGFYSEMQLWKANSPATFEGYDDSYFSYEAKEFSDLQGLPIPPPPLHLRSVEAALSIGMFNGYLGCAIAMICTTDEDPVARELENYNLVYKNMRIAAALIEKHADWRSPKNPYKPCDAISLGISLYLYHGARRCFSLAWQKWTILALRMIGREGLSNGFTNANTLEVMCDLETRMKRGTSRGLLMDVDENSGLGSIRERLAPLLMPRGEDDQMLAFYLRFGNEEADGDEGAVQVVARATWTETFGGQMEDLKLDIYESAVEEQAALHDRPQAYELFSTWRQAVEQGWHGYLSPDVENRLVKQEDVSPAVG
ncbi:uncharacterized protein LY89DRAFT_651193 [Mollisia scopiformis]|uniref:Zn(2)-C6 fungal-type domain-containing protein n=1 Tax=Mollisia scopiformis TaxID=149040 RepID=A0A194X1P4_MOLSC|nr:uncharacterized protein LY89DRAFT_651193 [Mollisia scopiformis]KUJ14113.1 hypothetical protein LY89DRAFT_651193 [Mollisia scopiformis]